jgi:transposase
LALNRRQFTREFTFQVVREVEAGKPLAQVAREYQGHPTVIRRWQQEHQRHAEQAFAGHGHSYKEEARMAELERMIGQLTLENALLKKALLRLEARHQEQNGSGGSSWSR